MSGSGQRIRALHRYAFVSSGRINRKRLSESVFCSNHTLTQVRAPRGIGGIAGVERQFQQQHSNSQAYINQAFEDLSQLMTMAQNMVSISKAIAEKLRSKQQEITSDEVLVDYNRNGLNHEHKRADNGV